jgi:hypothetical protein
MSAFDDFDLDVRFDPGPMPDGRLARGPVNIKVTQVTCEPDCLPEVDTAGLQCKRPPERTAVGPECVGLHRTVAHTCQESCNPVLCMEEHKPPTVLQLTCEDTCGHEATCPPKTCELGCETDTCPDGTCGCNTSETCNRDACEGGAITSPPCEDVSGAEDTCDRCPGNTDGCGDADTDRCVKTDPC